jgi:hypothetical protein
MVTTLEVSFSVRVHGCALMVVIGTKMAAKLTSFERTP